MQYFCDDTNYQVEGFTVDEEFLPFEKKFCGLPVVPFSNLETAFPPSEYDLFIGIGYSRLNQDRASKVLEGKSKGYKLASYISTKATVLTKEPIGENAFILENNVIQHFVKIGTNVTLWSGNHIGHHSEIGDHVFISSHVVISGGVLVGKFCFVGINSALRDHITVGERCVLGAGTMLLSNAAPEGVYVGQATERSRVPSSRLPRI